jgi:cell wall-associated NlpC family hydrolase
VERITSDVVDTALEAIGTPYVWGGTDQNGFDCSGLIQYAYAQHGIQIPRVSRDQIRAGRDVVPRVEALLPGDILGFTRDLSRSVSHVGLYVGEGRFIHSGSGGVRLSNLTDPYWREHVVAARRMVW